VHGEGAAQGQGQPPIAPEHEDERQPCQEKRQTLPLEGHNLSDQAQPLQNFG